MEIGEELLKLHPRATLVIPLCLDWHTSSASRIRILVDGSMPLGGALSAVRAQCNYLGVRLY